MAVDATNKEVKIEASMESKEGFSPRIGIFDPPMGIIEAVVAYTKFHNPYRAYYALNIIKSLRLEVNGIKPFLCGEADVSQFHTVPYIAGLKLYGSSSKLSDELKEKFGISQDIYDFSRLCVSGSLGCAYELIKDRIDFGINFYGGMSFAQRQRTSCEQSLNDTVLSILVLMQKYQKIFYISMDDMLSAVVEEAFIMTDRVYTLSFFHQRETDLQDKVVQTGDSDNFKGKAFKRVDLIKHLQNDEFVYFVSKVIDQVFDQEKPDVVVFQASSRLLATDISCPSNIVTEDIFKITSRVVDKVKSVRGKLLLLGGSGLSIADTARMYASQYLAIAGIVKSTSLIKEDIEDLKTSEYFSENPTLSTRLGNLVEEKGETYLDSTIASIMNEDHTHIDSKA